LPKQKNSGYYQPFFQIPSTGSPINKTEGLLNNSVNEFLNAFGAGRSEVSIGGISTKKLNYSLKTIQPLSELNANSKEFENA
jgi:hypothetical protein